MASMPAPPLTLEVDLESPSVVEMMKSSENMFPSVGKDGDANQSEDVLQEAAELGLGGSTPLPNLVKSGGGGQRMSAPLKSDSDKITVPSKHKRFTEPPKRVAKVRNPTILLDPITMGNISDFDKLFPDSTKNGDGEIDSHGILEEEEEEEGGGDLVTQSLKQLEEAVKEVEEDVKVQNMETGVSSSQQKLPLAGVPAQHSIEAAKQLEELRKVPEQAESDRGRRRSSFNGRRGSFSKLIGGLFGGSGGSAEAPMGSITEEELAKIRERGGGKSQGWE